MASLTVIKGPDQGRRFEIVEEVPTIGRESGNSIRLHDSECSRRHAEFRRTNNGHTIRDLGSSNGTYVNGQRIECVPIKTGDRITMGQTELIFTAAAAPTTGNLAERINMVTRSATVDQSSIVRKIGHDEGSQFLKHPEKADTPWLHEALSNLAVMYETSHAISRITDIEELMSHIMDLVFKVIHPDRGCIMIRDSEGQLRPSAVRIDVIEAESEEKIAISRTITDWVLNNNEGVIVLDAAHDERFSGAVSVAELGIREAICVPLKGRHDTLGVMYIDIKGEHREVLLTQKPSKFHDDQLKLMIAIAHQAGLAIEDSRYYQAMVQAERLAAVGQTIACVSHHIKNILQGLRSGSYLVDVGLKENRIDVVGQGWTVVQKNQEKIFNLVMDMLSYSKEREPSLEMADINQVVKEVQELMLPRAQELGARLDIRLDSSLPTTAVDPDGLHRAILNIVTNALDAVENIANARVVVSTSSDARGRYISIVISDNGIGIPESERGRIFQIFASTKGARGTGLGLAVSQKILHEHGGRIRVESQVGVGSKFLIDIPIRKVQVKAPSNAFDTQTDLNIEVPKRSKDPFEGE